MSMMSMRTLIVIGCVFATTVGVAAGIAARVSTSDGSVTGQTQISFGCPGAARIGSPSCHPWRAFAHARLAVARDAVGTSARTTQRWLVVSDQDGRFTLRLSAGDYTVTLPAQTHTLGGIALHFHVGAVGVTRLVVRFQGYPLMA